MAVEAGLSVYVVGGQGVRLFCRSSELWSLRCFSIGRIFVSSCM